MKMSSNDSRGRGPQPRAPVKFHLTKPTSSVPLVSLQPPPAPPPQHQQQSKPDIDMMEHAAGKIIAPRPRPSADDKDKDKQSLINCNRDGRPIGGLDLIITGYEDEDPPQPSPPPPEDNLSRPRSQSNSHSLVDSVLKLRRSRSRSSSQEMEVNRKTEHSASPPPKKKNSGYLVGPMKGRFSGGIRGRGRGSFFSYRGGVSGRGIKYYEASGRPSTSRSPLRSRSRSRSPSKSSHSRSRPPFKRRFLQLRTYTRSPSPPWDPKRRSFSSYRSKSSNPDASQDSTPTRTTSPRSLKEDWQASKSSSHSPFRSRSRSKSKSRHSPRSRSRSRSASRSRGRYLRSSRSRSRSSSPPRDTKRRSISCSGSVRNSVASKNASPPLKNDVDVGMKNCEGRRSPNHSPSRSRRSSRNRSRSNGRYSHSPSGSPSPPRDPKGRSPFVSSGTGNTTAVQKPSPPPQSLKKDEIIKNCEARRRPTHSTFRPRSSSCHSRSRSNGRYSPSQFPSPPRDPKQRSPSFSYGIGNTNANAVQKPSTLPRSLSLKDLKKEMDMENSEALRSLSQSTFNTELPSRAMSKEPQPRSTSPSPLDPRLKSARYKILNLGLGASQNVNNSSSSRPPTSTKNDNDVGTQNCAGSSSNFPISDFGGLLNANFLTDKNQSQEIGRICREWAQSNIRLVSLICNTDNRKLKKAQEEEVKAKEEELSQARKKLELLEGTCEKMKSELRSIKGSQLNREASELLKIAEEKCKLMEVTNANLLRNLECHGESLLELRRDNDERRKELERARNEFRAFQDYSDKLEFDLRKKNAKSREQNLELEELEEQHQEDLKSIIECELKLEKYEETLPSYEELAVLKEAELESLKQEQKEKDKRIAELELKLKEMDSSVSQFILADLERRHRMELLSLKKEESLKLAAIKGLVIVLKEQLENRNNELKDREEKKAEFDKLVQEFRDFERKILEKENERIEDVQDEDPPAKMSGDDDDGGASGTSNSAKVSIDLSKVANIMDMLKSKSKKD